MNKELSYWITLAHLPKIKTRIKNEIIVRLFEQKKTIIDFFNFTEEIWKNKFDLSDTDISIIKSGIDELPNNSFLVESLLEQGYRILPITSPEYSPLLFYIQKAIYKFLKKIPLRLLVLEKQMRLLFYLLIILQNTHLKITKLL